MTNPNRARYSLGAVLAIGGALLMAVGLLAVSYGHVYQLAQDAGADPWEARIIAATPDGLIVVALGVAGVARRAGRRAPWQVRAALVVGIAETTGANLVHGFAYGVIGIVVALSVPIVAELAYQLAVYALAHGRTAAPDAAPVPSNTDVPVAVEQPDTAPAVSVAAPSIAEEPSTTPYDEPVSPTPCPTFVSSSALGEQLADLVEALVERDAIQAVRECEQLGVPLSVRKLAAKFPRNGRARSSHWATQIKRRAAEQTCEVTESSNALFAVPDAA